MSSKLWRDPAMVGRSRSPQICRTPRRIVFVLGELLCLAAFLPVFGAPAKAAIGAVAIGLHSQASKIAPVAQVESPHGRRKYRYNNAGGQPAPISGSGNNNSPNQPQPIRGSSNNNASGQPPPAPPPVLGSGNNSSSNNTLGYNEYIQRLGSGNNSSSNNTLGYNEYIQMYRSGNNNSNNNTLGVTEYYQKFPSARVNPNLTVRPLNFNSQLRTIPVIPLHLR